MTPPTPSLAGQKLARQVQAAIYAALGCTRINYSSGKQVDKAASHIAQFVMPEVAAALSRARAEVMEECARIARKPGESDWMTEGTDQARLVGVVREEIGRAIEQRLWLLNECDKTALSQSPRPESEVKS